MNGGVSGSVACWTLATTDPKWGESIPLDLAHRVAGQALKA